MHLFGSKGYHGGENTLNAVKYPSQTLSFMPIVHGFVAGWGVGAFAIITITVLAPNMKSPYLAFLPGILFGLGAMTIQMFAGTIFGIFAARKNKLSKDQIKETTYKTSARTLLVGGMLFMAAGLFGLLFPSITS